jgi:hypothetical protein
MKALRQFNKIVCECPFCGKYGPKELVEGPKRLNVGIVITAIVLIPFTCFLSLIMLAFARERSLEAYWKVCGDTFDPDRD